VGFTLNASLNKKIVNLFEVPVIQFFLPQALILTFFSLNKIFTRRFATYSSAPGTVFSFLWLFKAI